MGSVDEQAAQQAGTGDLLLLKGHDWDGNYGAGGGGGGARTPGGRAGRETTFLGILVRRVLNAGGECRSLFLEITVWRDRLD